MVVPELELVVAAAHNWRVSNEETNRQKYNFTDRVFDPLVKVWQTL